MLCESPAVADPHEMARLSQLAVQKGLSLIESVKTAHSMAFERMLLLVKGGCIGKVVSVDATCTSMRNFDKDDPSAYATAWNSMCFWGPTAMLPIFQLLGTEWKSKAIVTHYLDKAKTFDGFSKIDFVYDNAVASIKVGRAAKSEGELVITGTEGYVYVPAPWWKTDYFEIRYEDPADNKRYFYQLDGEGIRNELLDFVRGIEEDEGAPRISRDVSLAIARVIHDFDQGVDVTEI